MPRLSKKESNALADSLLAVDSLFQRLKSDSLKHDWSERETVDFATYADRVQYIPLLLLILQEAVCQQLIERQPGVIISDLHLGQRGSSYTESTFYKIVNDPVVKTWLSSRIDIFYTHCQSANDRLPKKNLLIVKYEY